LSYSTQMKNQSRILIYRLGSLGDTIVALPCFHLIAKIYPDAQRYVLTNFPTQAKEAPIQSILGKSELAHGYFSYPLHTRKPKELMKLRSEIVAWNPDILVYLTPARGIFAAFRDLLFFKACGIHKIIGVPLTKDLQKHIYDSDNGIFEPEASRLARCISSLGDAELNDDASWDMLLTPKEERSADSALSGWSGREEFITCCAGTKMPSKDWGGENWAKLLSCLSEKTIGTGIAFIGSPDESDRCDILQKQWKGPSINLCSRLTPRESAVVIKRSILFLGHDSGPMHLASAVGTPTVAIFSARNKPAVWFPYGYEKRHRVIYHKTECYGCNLVECTKNKKKCIDSISIDEVLEAVEAVNSLQIKF